MDRTEDGFVLIRDHHEWYEYSKTFVRLTNPPMRAPAHYPCYVLMVEYGVVITRWHPHFLYAPEADRLVKACPTGEFYGTPDTEETYGEVFDRLESELCNL